MARILVVDDEEGVRSFVADSLSLDAHDVHVASGGQAALVLLQRHAFDLVITDLKMPGVDGLGVLRAARASKSIPEVILLTAVGSVESAVEAIKSGAFDYIQKPLESPEALRAHVERALARRPSNNTRSDEIPLSYGDPSMRGVVEGVRRVSPTTATVLLLGESGTGKEVVARAIHRASGRRGPFAAINCAVLSETLLESELFGHEKGAFTGALDRRIGRIEQAAGGTFFLDEIGELRPQLQAKLLRVIQEQLFERVGGARSIQADVRWIAATNRDLRAMTASGSFREDLYHRLAVFPLKIPPLRERRDDILPIADNLLSRIASRLGRTTLSLSDAARRKIREASWTGNVRALSNALERAAILADRDHIDVEQIWLDDEPDHGGVIGPPRSTGEVDSIDESRPNSAPELPLKTLAELERESIEKALAAFGGNRRKTAEHLGIGLRTLYEKLKRFGING
ncbi:MAG: sigma-54 dependent transcriptional regulator [Polyangiaceae bacterium]